MKLILPNKKILVELGEEDKTSLNIILTILNEICDKMEENSLSNINSNYGHWEIDDLKNTIYFLDDFLDIESIS